MPWISVPRGDLDDDDGRFEDRLDEGVDVKARHGALIDHVPRLVRSELGPDDPWDYGLTFAGPVTNSDDQVAAAAVREADRVFDQ